MDGGRSYAAMTHLADTHCRRDEREGDGDKEQAQRTISWRLPAGKGVAFVSPLLFAHSVTLHGVQPQEGLVALVTILLPRFAMELADGVRLVRSSATIYWIYRIR
ncbi:hypothetical protein PG988_007006 [Apiospora saccharicola]